MDLFHGAKQFKGQDYHALRKQQLSRGVRFVDDEFPVERMNILCFEPNSLEFKRPIELVEWPCLKSGDEYFSLKKGFVVNVNVLIAFTNLKFASKLWSKVFVDHSAQEWNKSHPREHPGIFRVRIWQDGVFLDVVVDDRLPCQNGKLVSTCSFSSIEFWPSILEKAYAKLLGGYDKLEQIRLEEILMDLTGGVTECIGIQSILGAPPMKHVEFYEKLENSFNERSLIIFCTEPKVESAPNPSVGFAPVDDLGLLEQFGSPGPMCDCVDTNTGLCAKYGYLLTRLCTVPKDTSLFGAIKDAFRRTGDCPIRARLLRLRCPVTISNGGAGFGEWKGSYSSSSPEWEELGLDARKRFRLTFDSESEFWISLDDVLRHMAGVIICRLPDTSIVSLSRRTWQLNEHHGAWHGHQTGGSLRFRDSFLSNPQYMFDIASDSEEVLLTLVRKHNRDPITMSIEPDPNPPAVGLGLFQVESNRITRIHQLGFTQIIYVEAARSFRTVLISRFLNPGRYVLIPFLEEPLSSAAYLLRLYLPKRTVSKELTLHIPPTNGALDFFFGTFKEAIRVHVHSAVNLLWPDGKNPPSPYCQLISEDGTTRTSVRYSTGNPVWNEFFIFYRRRPRKVPLIIQVMDKRSLGFDGFLGRHCFKEAELSVATQHEIALFGRDTKEERFTRMKGSLFVDFYRVDSGNFLQI